MFDALALASGFQPHQQGSGWTPRRHPGLIYDGDSRCTIHVWVDPRDGSEDEPHDTGEVPAPDPDRAPRIPTPRAEPPVDRRDPPTAAQAA